MSQLWGFEEMTRLDDPPGPPSTRALKPETECGFNYLPLSEPHCVTQDPNTELNVFSIIKNDF